MFFTKYLNSKKDKIQKESYYNPCPKIEYSFAMDYINYTLELEKNLEDKINMIKFIMGVVKNDIQYDLISKFLYSDMEEIKITAPIPISLMSKNLHDHDKMILISSDKMVDLSKDTIILLPWDRFRFPDTVRSIYKDEFVYIESNHKAYYYSDIDLCYVHNGNHSITTGIIKKEGIIKADEYDIKGLFKNLTTDGASWYINNDKEPLKEVFDFRIAILYELARIRYNLTNSL